MKKKLFSFLLCLVPILAINTRSNAQSTLIHYWHFNNYTSTLYIPDILPIDADYSILDTSKAKIWYKEMNGVSAVYATYEDPYPTIPADVDDVNLRMGQPGGTALRPRNPSDSMYLLFYLPTNGFQNIVLKYGTESSSVAHGQLHQTFDYSTDSGTTWRTSGLSEPSDSAWLVFKLVTVSFSDPLVNNNPKFVFRIHWDLPNDTMISGNNRFDNVTLEGDSITASITTTASTFGPFCNGSTSLINVAYTQVGTFTGSYFVQLSNPDGSFPASTTVNIIGTGTSSPILAAIPAGTAASALYRVRVINTVPVTYGSDNGSNIIVNGPPAAYALTGGGSYCAGGTGVLIGLANSQTGVSYQLYRGGTTAVGSTVPGGGSAISFGPQATAGVYTVRGFYTATTACISNMTGSVTVSVNPAPAAISGPTALCPAATISLSDGPAGGTWTSGTTSVATINSTGVVTGVATGTTTINYTLSDGCTASVVVTVSPGPGAISGPPIVCAGATASFTDGITGGLWTSSSTAAATIGSLTGTVTGVAPGPTTITYSLGGSACTVTKTITINPSPVAISGSANICIGATASLGDLTVGGTWSSTALTVATVSGTGVVTGTGMGTSTISYTLAGCAATAIATVNPTPAPIGGLSKVCVGSSITLTNTVGGGSWSSTSTAVTVGSSIGSVSGVSGGTAIISYSIGACFATQTITINPVAAISGPADVCIASTISLVPSIGGGTWSCTPSSVATISATGIVTGVFPGLATIAYNLPTGCSTVEIITVNPTPAAIGGPSSVCSGLSITLTEGIGGGTWSSTSASVGTTGNVTGTSAGAAVITYAIGSCIATKTVSVNPLPVITGASGVCVGSTIALTPSISGGTWSSAPSATAGVSGTGIVSGVVPGATTITYTLPTGCLTTHTVTVNTIPTAITGVLHTCVGATTTLGDGAGGGTWSITGGTIATASLLTGVITGVSRGTVPVSYSLGTGCTVFATVTVNPLPSPIGGAAHVCAGLTTTLTDVTPGGTWSSTTPATATVDSSSGTVIGLVAGTGIINYTIPTGCVTSINVTVNPLPADITVTGYVCIGINTDFSDASGSGTWSSSNTALATIDAATGVATGIAAGSPTITFTSIPTGCIATMTVTVNTIAPSITGTTQVCEGSTTSLGDILGGGTWSTGDSAIATVNTFTGVVEGVSEGTVLISYTHGLSVCPAATLITVNPLPAAISGSSRLCVASSTTLIDTGSGTWSSGNLFVANVGSATGIVTGTAAGAAAIYYTLPTGCSISTIETIDPLPAAITGGDYVCNGYTAALHDLTGGGVWSSVDPGIASINASGVVSGLSRGVTTISYTISTGCASTLSLNVVTIPDITGVSNICGFGDTLHVSDSLAGGEWSSTLVTISATGFVTAYATGIAAITYSFPSGCFATATLTVNTSPGAITGNPRLCIGLSTSLSDTTSGGTWISSNTAVASVDIISGVVTGVSAGTAMINYTNAAGCMVTTTVTVSTLPSAISGSSVVCAGAATTFSDTGGGTWNSSNITVANAGVTSGVITGLSAGLATITYNQGASCFVTKIISVNPLPVAYPIIGGGNYCAGGAGVDIRLGSSAVADSYQLYDGGFAIGAAIPGTGSGLDFGLQTAPGSYSVVAVSAATGCTNASSGSATIVIDLLPAPYTVTGGGTYCVGGTGVHVGLLSSGSGINYRLYNGTTPTGGSIAGTGASLDFGLHTAPGVYSVIGTNATTGCTSEMPDSVIVSVSPTVTPSVSITSSLGNPLCAGTSNTFTATAINGGAAPAYQWKVNGINAGAGSSSYSYVPANADVVSVILTSNAACAVPDTAIGSVTMTVDAMVVPSVTITANPGMNISKGEYDTLTAVVANGGTSPTYQWKLNGVVTGGTSSTYIGHNFSNGDVVTCVITSSGICAGQTASSSFTIDVSNVGVKPVAQSVDNISVSPNPNKGEFTIRGTLGLQGTDNEVSLEITDMLGQAIYKDNVSTNNGEINKRVLLNSSLANGMYILAIRSATENKVFHIVIER